MSAAEKAVIGRHAVPAHHVVLLALGLEHKGADRIDHDFQQRDMDRSEDDGQTDH